MAARAIWKGTLHVGSIALPLKLYSAVQDRSVHFRLLEAAKHAPVEQKMVHPGTGEAVEKVSVKKGFPLDDGSFVLLEAEELKELEPEASRDITISRFVPESGVPRALFVRPYYLGPDGRSEVYFALSEALASAKVVAIAHWVMRKHTYHGALFARDGYLLLATLRHASELVSADSLPKPTGRAPSERELSMAEQLIASYSGKLELAEFHDEYRERVLDLVHKKAEGKRVRIARAPEKKSEGSLVDALSRSLKQTKKPPVQRAGHRKPRKVA